ncbi:MAG: glycoside hydrolase family 32 protein, partial [Lachnospiraceae bacterium]|nr:glycoside hydrolase family 32 protein [Lachnospiraceae bacterium]
QTRKPSQRVSCAFSEDGIHFTKYDKNPVISTYPEDGGPDFRDPAAAVIDGKSYIVMASGHPETKTANLLLYESEDLFNWTYRGVMREWADSLFTECPSFMKTDAGYLLAASVCSEAKRYFSVMYGTFADGKYTIVSSGEPDKGPDQYAGQAFKDPKGRTLLITWIPGWRYAGYREKDIGCMSVPRELTCKDGTIRAFPAEEVRHLLKKEDPALKRTDTGFIIERDGREPVIYEGPVDSLDLIRDEYVLEVFVDHGKAVYTVLL